MISVEEGKRLLIENIPAARAVHLPLEKTAHHILAEDIVSPVDVPLFDNSAMDGYALDYKGYREGRSLTVRHKIQAGDSSCPGLEPGEVARIFTGAPIPAGADTVVMQEKVVVDKDQITIADTALKKGANVRLKGSQTAAGTKVAVAGTRLKPGIIGLLASLGLAEVNVLAAPRVGVIVTGKELVKPGNKLAYGQIYESNTYMLQAALSEMHLVPLLTSVDDDEAQILKTIAGYLESCDVLIITGGISVGDYDFVQKALEKAGVKKIFYKVRQKPGKPLYCGRKGNTMVFGLPGNPAAVLTCFYQYVNPCIRTMMGIRDAFDHEIHLKLSGDIAKREHLTCFMKGKRIRDEVAVLPSQESYKLDAFVESDCLVQLNEGRDRYARGEEVRVLPLSKDFFAI